MAQGLITKSTLEDIGQAIRDKAGSTALMKPADMPEAIRSIHPVLFLKREDGAYQAVYKIIASPTKPEAGTCDLWIKTKGA